MTRNTEIWYVFKIDISYRIVNNIPTFRYIGILLIYRDTFARSVDCRLILFGFGFKEFLRTALWSFMALVLDNGLEKPGLGLEAKSYTDTGIGLDSSVLCNHTMCLNCVWLPLVIVIFDVQIIIFTFPSVFWQFLWASIIDLGLDFESASLGLDTPDIDPGLDLGVEDEVLVMVTAGLLQFSTVWHFLHSWINIGLLPT